MLRQILPVQIGVGLLVGADVLAAQLLHQAVLMRAVIALHAPLGLRRTRGHQPNAQLRAHASELRDRSLAPQPFALAGRALVQILPVHVERLRHAVALDPAAQRVGRCPDRLLLAEPPERSTGGVVHHVHEAAFFAALFQPVMKAAVQLHQFTKMRLRLPPLAVRLAFALSLP